MHLLELCLLLALVCVSRCVTTERHKAVWHARTDFYLAVRARNYSDEENSRQVNVGGQVRNVMQQNSYCLFGTFVCLFRYNNIVHCQLSYTDTIKSNRDENSGSQPQGQGHLLKGLDFSYKKKNTSPVEKCASLINLVLTHRWKWWHWDIASF